MVEPQPLPSPATKHASITRKFGHAPVFSFLVLFAAGPVLAIIGKKLSGVNARPIVESLRRSIRAEHFLGLWQGDDLLKLVLDELGQVGGQKDLVVFLRSFEDDRYFWNLRGMYGMWVSEEEELSQAIAPLGPVVAIGRPGEMLQTPGAARMYVEDEQWQKEVANLVFVTVALFGAARWNDITAIVGSVGMLLMTLGMVGLSLWLIVFIWRVFK
jgi:hypothetical protein